MPDVSHPVYMARFHVTIHNCGLFLTTVSTTLPRMAEFQFKAIHRVIKYLFTDYYALGLFLELGTKDQGKYTYFMKLIIYLCGYNYSN